MPPVRVTVVAESSTIVTLAVGRGASLTDVTLIVIVGGVPIDAAVGGAAVGRPAVVLTWKVKLA